MQELFRLSCAAIAAAIFIPSVAEGSQVIRLPAPPKQALEFFGPTYTEHRSDSVCGVTKVSLLWRYTASGLGVTSITFNGKQASTSELAKVNGWLSKLDGDALARIECSVSGASFAFFHANLAGTASPKQIRIDWVDGRAHLISENGFN